MYRSYHHPPTQKIQNITAKSAVSTACRSKNKRESVHFKPPPALRGQRCNLYQLCQITLLILSPYFSSFFYFFSFCSFWSSLVCFLNSLVCFSNSFVCFLSSFNFCPSCLLRRPMIPRMGILSHIHPKKPIIPTPSSAFYSLFRLA